jgi:Protein of unknown function DUF45
MYQAFMSGYVRRINQATFKVTIGGVRIGTAKYTRLAQINLKSRIITFSKYAIENVPERGRRYLVLHELAHVKEASHNKRFWDFVGKYEPDYRLIGRNLENAFKKNVKAGEKRDDSVIHRPTFLNALMGSHLTKQASEPANGQHIAGSDNAIESALHNLTNNGSHDASHNVMNNSLNNVLNNVVDIEKPIVYAEDPDQALWNEIEEEFTYWRDDSDEDSDVEGGTECDGGAWSFENPEDK